MDLYWVTPTVAVATRPRGGDWLADEMADLRRQDVDVLVSCLTRDEERELDLADERTEATASGLEYFSLPIPDRGVPDSRATFEQVVGELVRAERKGRHLAVHCRQGLGRSPLVAAAVLVRDGMSPDHAWKLVGERRGAAVPETDDQRDWLRRTAASAQLL